jgi:hypothetical protein
LRPPLRVVLPIVGLLASAAPLGAAEPAGELERVRACVAANTPKRSSVLAATLAAEGEPEIRFKLYWRRLSDGERRALIRFVAPEDLAGSAVLLQGLGEARPRVHLYLPDLGRPQRLTSREQLTRFLGRADLGIEEIGLLLDPLGDPGLRVLDPALPLEGRFAWLLEATADPAEGARYARTRTFVDQQLCAPLRAEFYEDDAGEPSLMRTDPDRFTREADAWIPREIVFQDPDGGPLRTLRIEDVEVDVPLAASLLTIRALADRGGAVPAVSSPPPSSP